MGSQNYGRVVTAALAETKSKFALAEALALDVPPRRRGPTADGEQAVRSYLNEAREAIIAAGGEPRAVGTLEHYRATALWVSKDLLGNFAWVPGVSYSAHEGARLAGMSYEDFAAMPSKTVDEVRRVTGRAGTDGPPQQIIRNMPPGQRAEVVREALAEPEVADQVVSDLDARQAVRRAIDRHDTGLQQRAREGYELREPRSVQVGARADLEYALTKARQALEDASEAVDTLAAHDWPDNSREAATVLIQRVAAGAELVRAKIEGRDLDQELQALLESGEA